MELKKFKTLAIVQARLTSSRFPGKVLKKINNLTLIQILKKRLSLSKKIDQVVFAIPNNKLQKHLKNHLKNINAEIYEGNENNVLDRFYKTAIKYKPNIIVRITADCPIIDAKIIDKLISKAEKNNFDYISNVYPPSFPDGLDVSVFPFKTLEKTWKRAKSKYDKEHVVTYMQKNKKFKKYNLLNSKNLSSIRLTVDEIVDLDVIKKILSHFKNFKFDLKSIEKLLKNKSEIFNSNNHLVRDEGSMKKSTSAGQIMWKRASKIIPGGNMLLSKRPQLFLPYNWPTYYKKAKGCKIVGLDGNSYLDMSLMGVGTNILGYGNKEVDEAVKKVVRDGNLSTLNCPEEVYLSEKLIEMHPWAGMVKLTRTGGEANAVAVRIARAASGRDKVAICGYHGWHDWYLAGGLSKNKNLQSHLLPDLELKGVPKFLKNSAFAFEYNNLGQFKKLIKQNPNIGVVKMEVSRNFKPKNNFLKEIRKITKSKGIILIFDECTSGFRENFGGLHLNYKVEPDISIFGKALGNGYAINAVVGKKEVMRFAKSSFISSTFWSERIGPVAALKTLEVMQKNKSWNFITNQGKKIKMRWKSEAHKNNIKIRTYGLDALASFSILSKNSQKYKTFITQEMLKKKILASNSIYLSTAHSNQLLNKYFYHLGKIFKTIGECESGKLIDNLLESPIAGNTFKRLN